MKRTMRLGGPLALGELGWMSTYIVDAIMIGRLPHSALSISASSLGNTVYYALVFCAVGILNGVETLTAQAAGRGDRKDSFFTLAQSLWFVALATPLVTLATLGSLPLLRAFGTPPEIVAETGRYLHALVWSTAPLLFYMALRRYLQSMNRVALVSVSLITASLVNLLGDWVFLYGHLGARAMGIAGSGWATCVVRVYMLVLLIIGLRFALRSDGLKFTRAILTPDFTRLRLIARIGWPTAIQSLTDLGFSTYMSIICARLGATLLAAHQVVLDLNAFIYMVPAGLSYATVVRVGRNAGRGSLLGITLSAQAGLVLGLGFIVAAGSLFAGFPHTWASIYTNDPAVIAAASPLFLICGFLLCGDACNVILCSALTGLGDTRTPLMVNTGVYWAIGVPLSYWLGFHTSLSLRGLWIGRAVAAVCTGITMAIVWRNRLHQMEVGTEVKAFTLLQPVHAK